MALFLAFIVVVGAIILFIRRASSVATAVDKAKARLFEKAIRDAFIANPRGEASELYDAAMDRIAQHATISNRSDLRKSLQLSDQILVYRCAALDAGREVLKALSRDASVKDLREALHQRISSQVIDRIADEREEQIDNSVALREAMVRYAFEEITTIDFSDRDPEEMKGTLAAPCPRCELLFRDLSSPKCRSCGHVFGQNLS